MNREPNVNLKGTDDGFATKYPDCATKKTFWRSGRRYVARMRNRVGVVVEGRRERLQAAWFITAAWVFVLLQELVMPVVNRSLSPNTIARDLVCSVLGLGLALASGLLIQGLHRISLPIRAALSVLLAFGCSAILLALDNTLVRPIADLLTLGRAGFHAPDALVWQVVDASLYIWVFSFGATLVLLLDANARYRERSRQLAEADAAAKSAQLAALRFQLNPHFLFNTLNALSALVVTRRTDQAEVMIERLSEFLRSTLAANWSEEITLQDELAGLEGYLEIEAARFEDRFHFDVDVPAELLGAIVPNLLLQPLAENSIKYAVARSSAPVRLQVGARARRDELELWVSDAGAVGAPPIPGRGAGVGLSNVAGRLAALYGSQGRLQTEQRPDGYRTTIRMPLALRPTAPLPQAANTGHRIEPTHDAKLRTQAGNP